VAPEYPGRGDARRSIELLWGVARPPGRGPKPGLAVASIVGAAVELADREGLAGVSMRRVAEQLGVGTMSLYTYVRTKSELLDLMVDAILGELARDLTAADARVVATGATGWRPRLEAAARADWDLFLRHRWLLGVSSSRAVLGPNESTVFELRLRLVDELGLDAREMVAATDLMATYVAGAVRSAADALEAPAATGKTDTEWWGERAPLLDELGVYDPERFPVVTKVSAAGGFDAPDEGIEYSLQFALTDFEFGLQRVLDGLGALIEERRRLAGG
jgi:AcrR family transcriptional regulator